MEALARRARRLRGAAGVALLAGVLWLVYGPGTLGYDSEYALVWGRELVHGHLPEYGTITSPTPHPLANLVGAILAPLGDAAYDVAPIVVFVALAALAVGGCRLARIAFGPAVGVAFALFLLTRPLLVNETREAFVDIPFLAFLVAAATAAVRTPRSHARVMLFLTFAGLLRPEAWLYTAVYVAFMLPSASRRDRRVLAFGALVAPLLWCATDLIVTGDPLFSLHGTQEIAASIGRTRGFGNALSTLPHALQDAIGAPLGWLGLAGFLVALWAFLERSVVPVAVFVVGLVTYLAIGVAHLSLIPRYLLAPAVMLALFAAVMVVGWTALDRDSRVRRGWMIASIAAVVPLVLTARTDHERIKQFGALIEVRRSAIGQLSELAGDNRVEALVQHCGSLVTTPSRAVAVIAYKTGRRLSTIRVTSKPSPGSLALWPATRLVNSAFYLGLTRVPPDPPPFAPIRRPPVAATPSWRAYGPCS